ncbi:MAG: LrgB family protein [Alphaproteobacteria bacterium]|nr:LrgB family protein [Alphaproteobacteria bacterium]
MMQYFTATPFFGTTITLLVFVFATILNKKWSNVLTTPLLVSTMIIVAILVLLEIPYAEYNKGAQYITYFLTPVTVCFAVPMYKNLDVLKKYAAPIILAILVGSVASVMSVIIISTMLGLSEIIIKSLAAISTTTAIAIGITQELGGNTGLTTSAVIITGILGASVSDVFCRKMGWRTPVSCGIAIGTSAHSAGTIKAMEMGKLTGAMSSLAIVISGVITAFIAPVIVNAFF